MLQLISINMFIAILSEYYEKIKEQQRQVIFLLACSVACNLRAIA